jgi:hypothetical protein
MAKPQLKKIFGLCKEKAILPSFTAVIIAAKLVFQDGVLVN